MFVCVCVSNSVSQVKRKRDCEKAEVVKTEDTSMFSLDKKEVKSAC